MNGLNVGDRVLIRSKIWYLRHRQKPTGVILAIDGAYHDVKPSWCNWIVELYPNEMKRLGRSKYTKKQCRTIHRKIMRELFG